MASNLLGTSGWSPSSWTYCLNVLNSIITRHVSPWLATYWRVLLLLFLVLSVLLLFSSILFSKETSLLFSIWALTFPLHHTHQGPSFSAALLLSFSSIPAISMATQLLHLVLNFHFLAPDDIGCFFMCMFAICSSCLVMYFVHAFAQVSVWKYVEFYCFFF